VLSYVRVEIEERGETDMQIMKLLDNRLLINSLIAWISAQVIKTIIYAIVNRRIDWERLFGDGGMPSGHSATVTALALTAALHYGFDSAVFAVCAILAIIVMHDATGVRLEAGKHARAINELMQMLESNKETEEKLKELLGHTPLQVISGVVLGAIIAIILT